MAQQQQTPIIVTAIPVNENNYPVQVQSTPYTVTVESSNQAICRGCGRSFIRAPGVLSSQAQYYRCEECNSLTNVVVSSCIII